MKRNTGHWWSPDDAWLAVARVDESPVHVVTRTAIGADGTRIYRAALSRRRHAQCRASTSM